MNPSTDIPSAPPAKRVAAVIVAVVVLTMGVLVWFDSKSIPPEPSVQYQADGKGPPLLSFPFLDKANYDAKGDDLNVTFPEDMAALDGKKVSLAGFMTPYEKLDDMHQFLLMPSSGGCFFCQAPSLSQVAMVQQTTPSGSQEKLPYIQEPVLVTATLHLYAKGSKHAAHQAGFIFALDDAQVVKLSTRAAEAAGLTGAPPLARQ